MFRTWESMDGFCPPTRKHIPKSEFPALNRAVAQKTNDALQMLKGPYKPLSKTRPQARKHEVKKCVDFENLRFLYRPGFPDKARLSQLEKLPPGGKIQKMIFGHLSFADLICVYLSSYQMTRGILHYRTVKAASYDAGDDNFIHWKPDVSVSDYVRLMVRLEDWMPTSYKFCHHCLLYVPRYCFGMLEEVEDAIVCMDCKTHLPPMRRKENPTCEGCIILSDALKSIWSNWDNGASDLGSDEEWKGWMEDWQEDKSTMVDLEEDDHPLTWSIVSITPAEECYSSDG